MAQVQVAFLQLNHALFGVYAWEFLVSLDFDWQFISGRRKFRWPLVFYFLGRYLMLGTLVGIIIALNHTTPGLDCHGLYLFNQLAGSACSGLACINLSLRTIAVWGNNRFVIGGLVLLMLGHWALILQGVQLTVGFVDGVGCVIQKTNNTLLAATFIYTMSFDLVIMVLNVWRLAFGGSGTSAMRKHSGVAQMIFGDGVIYFFIAFLGSFVATVFMLLDLNALMNVIFNVPAVIAATIASGRLVRRLNNFGQGSQAEVYTHSTSNAPLSADRGINGTAARSRSGVQIRMETFTRTDQPETQQYNDKQHTVEFSSHNSPTHDDIESKAQAF